MNDQVSNPLPLRFEESMEHIAENEVEIIAELNKTLMEIGETTFKHSGHAIRSVHAKSHGILKGIMTVEENLPPDLAQGIFSADRTYPIVMRFSTTPGDMLDDAVSTPRGVAIKVIGVEGPRLSGSEGDTTQDWIMVNGPAFGAANPQKFLGSLKLLAATTDRAPELKKIVSSVARATEAILEAFGSKSPTVISLGGQKMTNILGETFYSQVPVLFGPYIAKLSLAPVSPGLTALTDAPLISHGPNALRDAVIEHFSKEAGEWAFRAQLSTDLETMPIEDASVIWPEDKSPYRTVARIVVEPQNPWSAENIAQIDEGFSFSPWHGVAAHRPLGAVMRSRKAIYENGAQFRASHNGCPIHEPRP